MTITRSHSGSVYAGTELILSADISYSELQQRAVDVDISLDVRWTRDNDVITSDSAVTAVGNNYTASLSYSPIATSDSGQISVTVRPSHDSLYMQSVTASESTQLDVEGMRYDYTVAMGTYSISLPPDLPDPVVTISGPTNGTAGEEVQLTCSVSVVEYLTVQPTVEWSGGSVDRGNGVTESDTTHSGVMSMKTLTFSPLLTSHGAKYTCQADINIPSISLMKTASNSRDVMVESKSVTSSPLSVVCVVYC